MEAPSQILPEYHEKQLEWLHSKKVCATCQSIFTHWDARGDWKSPHMHHSLGGLQASAREGCPICEMFLTGFSQKNAHEARLEDYPARALVVIDGYQPSRSYFVNLVFQPIADSSPCLTSLIFVDLADLDENTTAGAVNEETDCPQNWRLARRWLQECSSSHAQCIRPVMSRKLPSRLVSVGGLDVQNPQVRLCLSDELSPDTPYLTLSHCWGTKKFTTLSQGNLEALRFAIPEEALTKTFKDAIKATQELGFGYVWIDSLCIIQDSKADWSHEAALMGNVYANSVLNLRAADARDGDEGCFSRRAAPSVWGWKVRLQGNVETWNCHHRDFMLPDGVLSRRAWAFQELCLAPRSLSFSNRGLSWECRQKLASETLPKFIDNGMLTIPGILTKRIDSASDWFSVVTSYSKGELTYGTDKLVAISGIARLFSGWLETEFLAGMWRKGLEAQLTWHVYDLRQLSERPCPAPSWSWASINNGVSLEKPIYSDKAHNLVQVCDAFVTSPGDPFTEVTGGLLTLIARVFGKGAALSVGSESFCIECPGDIRLLGSVVNPDHRPHNLHGELYFLLVQLVDRTIRSGTWNLRGLVLRLKGFKSYVRVGSFAVGGREAIEIFMSTLSGEQMTIENLLQDVMFSDTPIEIE